jgi:hypothetical protein
MKLKSYSILTLFISSSFAFAENNNPNNKSAQKVGDILLNGNSVPVAVESQDLEVSVDCEFQTRTAQVSEDYGHPGSFHTVVVAKGYQCPLNQALDKVKQKFPQMIKVESLDETTKSLFELGSNLGIIQNANLKMRVTYFDNK